MKKFFVTLALLVGTIGTIGAGAAHAQVYFDSGSARPNNPHGARHQVERQRAHPPVRVRVRERLVRCRDGARRVARMCRGHGGVARR